SDIQSEFIPSPADELRPERTPFINQKNLKKLKPEFKTHFSPSSSSIPQPSLSPTISDSTNSRGPSPLPVNPPEMIGIIIAAIIATIVVILIIKKITFGKMSIESSEKRQLNIQNDNLNVCSVDNNKNDNLRFGNDYVISNGLDENNDPLFD
ncbi:10488_t:CDS:1, partial [Racocetra persica]